MLDTCISNSFGVHFGSETRGKNKGFDPLANRSLERFFFLLSGKAARRAGKYSVRSLSALKHIDNLPPGTDAGLVCAAYSESSWKRTSAALNSYKRFAKDSGTTLIWPFSASSLNHYVSWALKTAKLSPSTVNVYLSGNVSQTEGS
jgi:hypothetical protein